MKTKLINVGFGRRVRSDAVYIGRRHGGEWGNPFEVGRHGTREEVIWKYEDWMRSRMRTDPALRERVRGLYGKTLACHCVPKRCHGEVLVRLCTEEAFEYALT
jgi:hypothetical protein